MSQLYHVILFWPEELKGSGSFKSICAESCHSGAAGYGGGSMPWPQLQPKTGSAPTGGSLTWEEHVHTSSMLISHLCSHLNNAHTSTMLTPHLSPHHINAHALSMPTLCMLTPHVSPIAHLCPHHIYAPTSYMSTPHLCPHLIYAQTTPQAAGRLYFRLPSIRTFTLTVFWFNTK